VMQKALRLPGTDSYSIYAYGMGLLKNGKNAKAMEAFATNQRQHSEEKFWTALGFARGYTAMGDKKKAIANWEIVLRNIPPNLSNRAPMYEESLKKLKQSS
jgi:tetratricopeptide (TPR) repeat protein